MKVLILFFLFSFSGIFLYAQNHAEDSLETEQILPEFLTDLEIEQDERLVKMLKWHIESNNKRNGINGYRVEIFFSSDLDAREMAENKKAEFLSEYPDYPAVVKYVAPNFRVRVGNFRTKNEALKLYKEIEKTYPVAFVVSDVIDFPLIKKPSDL